MIYRSKLYEEVCSNIFMFNGSYITISKNTSGERYVYLSKTLANSDNWEYLPPYTIMDDMDALDEGKGLSFSWYKPWFGAQDAITITDKFKPKEDITNGKPLIWLNNFKLTETFKSDSALDYIKRNMVYVDLGERDLEPFYYIIHHIDDLSAKFGATSTNYIKGL